MYSSPATPSATGSSCPSSTHALVSLIGRPIGTWLLPSSRHVHCVTWIVVSVGPYRFYSDAPFSLRSASDCVAAGIASPPQMM